VDLTALVRNFDELIEPTQTPEHVAASDRGFEMAELERSSPAAGRVVPAVLLTTPKRLKV